MKRWFKASSQPDLAFFRLESLTGTIFVGDLDFCAVPGQGTPLENDRLYSVKRRLLSELELKYQEKYENGQVCGR